MICVPFQSTAWRYDLFIVLNDESFDRIKAYDPAEIVVENLGESWNQMRIRNIIICYATKEEEERVIAAGNVGPQECLAEVRKLTRGWAYRPDRGDNYDPYTSVKHPR